MSSKKDDKEASKELEKYPLMCGVESLGELLQLVVGFWGEISTDLDQVIHAMAKARVPYVAQ